MSIDTNSGATFRTFCYTLLFSLFVSFHSQAQIVFEPGYFIDSNGKRVECLIKNEDWLRTPSSITYKLASAGEPIVLDKSEMKEFAVRHNKYVRATVEVDTSSQNMKRLSSSRRPLWDSQDVLLKVLVEGKASLYYYDRNELVLFFYNVNNAPIRQLEYKTYLSKDKTTDDLTAGQNLTYIKQLEADVTCGDEAKKLSRFSAKYRQDYLVGYFKRYNQCSGSDFILYKKDTSKEKNFHLLITPGASLAAGKVEGIFYGDQDFPSRKITMRLGVQAEFILPFNNNKWSLFLEPTYQSYEADGPVSITYSSIETAFGLRHYFYLNNDLKLFLNAAAVADLPLEYSAKWGNTQATSKRLKYNFAPGIGLAYKRLSVEGRYYTLRTGFDTSGFYTFDFVKSSIILGYRLF